jgi:hypothetical protein
MPKLNDAQLVILAAAARRDDGSMLPLPKRLKLDESAASQMLAGFVETNLAAELPANRDAAVWQGSKDGERNMLVITNAGLRTIGIAPNGDSQIGKVAVKKNQRRPTKAAKPKATKRRGTQRVPKKTGASSTDRRPDTKQTQVINLLRRSKGATIEQMMEATGWQAHSVRGVMSGTLKKKLGLKIVSERAENRARAYRIAGRG